MKLFSKLLKEEYDLDTQILNNRIAQYKHLVQISNMPSNENFPMSDKLDVFDKLRDLEQAIFQQLSDRAKSDNQRRLFGLDVKSQDRQIRDEFLRQKARKSSIEKYKSMNLKELIKTYFDSGSKKKS
jgi:hypothetical protein